MSISFLFVFKNECTGTFYLVLVELKLINDIQLWHSSFLTTYSEWIVSVRIVLATKNKTQ